MTMLHVTYALYYMAIIAILLPKMACSRASELDLRPALDSITADDLLRHTKVLSSDALEGRSPGTRGEELTVRYLTEEFTRAGLKPGNPDGRFVQDVPIAGIRSESQAAFRLGTREIALRNRQDSIVVSRRVSPEIRVEDSEVVFVGYGVVAPEFGWDDYKGMDVRGKTIVVLVNDPPVLVPGDEAKLDDSMFRGAAMTYHGRWTYKYEIASERGAAAAVIVHETGPAGYPFEVVLNSWGGENFDLRRPDGNMGRVAVESWISLDTAKRLFALAGRDFDQAKKQAATKEFKPVSLGARATFIVRNSMRELNTRNVIARLEGSDPSGREEHILYSAHWDHLGRDESLADDQIFNGALDNASGTAALLELAEAYAVLDPKPKRSVLFVALAAEERGLLGAKYYAENPLYPLEKTLAAVNMDGMNPWGRTKDIILIGLGNSTLDDAVQEVARRQSRVAKPDPEPEKGFFYRSDHFEFAKQGVPALFPDAGIDFVGKPPGFGMQKRQEYTERDYHKVSDEIKPDWDLSGAVEDLQLLFQVGIQVSQAEKYPEWKPGTEFKARRDAMLNRQVQR